MLKVHTYKLFLCALIVLQKRKKKHPANTITNNEIHSKSFSKRNDLSLLSNFVQKNKKEKAIRINGLGRCDRRGARWGHHSLYSRCIGRTYFFPLSFLLRQVFF